MGDTTAVDIAAIYSGFLSFSELRTAITPEPKRGRVNTVLRKRLCIKNTNGYWEFTEAGRALAKGSPSRPHWHISVVPQLVHWLNLEYPEEYQVLDSVERYLSTRKGRGDN